MRSDIRSISNEGREAGSPLRLSLGPRQRYAGPATQAGTGGYLLVRAGSALAAGERFGRPGEFEAAVNALDANGGALRLYAPQYARSDSFPRIRPKIVSGYAFPNFDQRLPVCL